MQPLFKCDGEPLVEGQLRRWHEFHQQSFETKWVAARKEIKDRPCSISTKSSQLSTLRRCIDAFVRRYQDKENLIGTSDHEHMLEEVGYLLVSGAPNLSAWLLFSAQKSSFDKNVLKKLPCLRDEVHMQTCSQCQKVKLCLNSCYKCRRVHCGKTHDIFFFLTLCMQDLHAPRCAMTDNTESGSTVLPISEQCKLKKRKLRQE